MDFCNFSTNTKPLMKAKGMSDVKGGLNENGPFRLLGSGTLGRGDLVGVGVSCWRKYATVGGLTYFKGSSQDQ